MKLLFAIIQEDDVKPLINALVDNEISVTRVSSSGGFLRGGNSTLMIGVEKDRLQDALDIIKAKSHRRSKISAAPTFAINSAEAAPVPVEVSVGGATVFIVDVEEFHKF